MDCLSVPSHLRTSRPPPPLSTRPRQPTNPSRAGTHRAWTTTTPQETLGQQSGRLQPQQPRRSRLHSRSHFLNPAGARVAGAGAAGGVARDRRCTSRRRHWCSRRGEGGISWCRLSLAGRHLATQRMTLVPVAVGTSWQRCSSREHRYQPARAQKTRRPSLDVGPRLYPKTRGHAAAPLWTSSQLMFQVVLDRHQRRRCP